MRIRSFVVAYALVLAILLFADRRPDPSKAGRFTRVMDLTEAGSTVTSARASTSSIGTHLISPAALIPGTWGSGQIPAERLVAPLVVVDIPPAALQVTLDGIAVWESSHGTIPQGAVVAIRKRQARVSAECHPMPITSEAAQFLMDARNVLGFAVESNPDMAADRNLSRQIALHGAYVVAEAAHLTALPETGSLVIVAPAKNKSGAEAPVRLLAMVR